MKSKKSLGNLMMGVCKNKCEDGKKDAVAVNKCSLYISKSNIH